MAYEIPQKLEYNEKIAFGLTFKQLAYALFFSFIAFACHKKIELEPLRYALMGTSLLTGAGFYI